MLLIGVIVGIAYAAGGVAKPVDATYYWDAGTSTALYPVDWSQFHEGHLFYPPPVAQLSTVLQPLGWPVFVTVLMVAIFGAFWFCARGWSLPLVCIGIPYYLGIGPEALSTLLGYALVGNVQWILAALSVVAVRHPTVYPALALTKVTTAIGWLWPLARGEWRAAAIGAFATIGVASISFIAAPELWFDFVAFAGRNITMANPPLPTFPIPYGVRIVIAIGLVLWSARRGHRWCVPIAAGLALPVIWGIGFLPFVVAATRLVERPKLSSLGI
jgi:hypothetical protein